MQKELHANNAKRRFLGLSRLIWQRAEQREGYFSVIFIFVREYGLSDYFRDFFARRAHKKEGVTDLPKPENRWQMTYFRQ